MQKNQNSDDVREKNSDDAGKKMQGAENNNDVEKRMQRVENSNDVEKRMQRLRNRGDTGKKTPNPKNNNNTEERRNMPEEVTSEPERKTVWRSRLCYVAAFFLLLAIEVLIALFVHDAFIRPYLGDVLVVIVVYCFVRIFIPQHCRFLPLYVFFFAAGVEFLQYFRLVERLGVQGNRFLRILLGSVFDWKDIACYAAGCILLGGWEILRNKRKRCI